MRIKRWSGDEGGRGRVKGDEDGGWWPRWAYEMGARGGVMSGGYLEDRSWMLKCSVEVR